MVVDAKQGAMAKKLQHGRLALEKLLQVEDNAVLEQVTQKSCGISVLGGHQGSARQI